MQTILLTGATGSVGFETLKLLIKKNDIYKVRALEVKNRRTESKLKPYRKNAEIIWGDITDYECVKRAVQGCDAVIHTAAIIPPYADEHPDLAECVNTGGTKNLVDAIGHINPGIFLIYTSSISVYGDRIKNPEINSLDAINPSPRDFYALTKINAEHYIKCNSVNFTIFRLSAVFRPKMKPDPLMFHMPLNTQLEIVTAKDTANALVTAIEKKEVLNERIFNLGGGKDCRISYKEFLAGNFKLFGLDKLDFPERAFAEKNFHCGIYKDSHVLNRILRFQTETLEDHFRQVAAETPLPQKIVTWLLRHIIKRNMLKNSEPFKAVLTRNIEMINYFFNSKTSENALH